MRFITLIAAVVSCVIVSVLCSRASADIVVEDQFPTMQTWTPLGTSSYPNMQPLGSGSFLGWRSMTGIRGNGQILSSIEGYYFRRGLGGTPNEGNLSETDFRLSFWNEESSMLSDPRLNNPGPLDRAFLFDTPSNPDWETPAFVHDSYEVFLLRFDLSGLNIMTTPGQLHYITVTPQGIVGPAGSGTGSGAWSILSSSGGDGSIGSADPARVWAFNMGTPPVNALPDRPEIALRVSTVPSPGALTMLSVFGLASLTHGRRRS